MKQNDRELFIMGLFGDPKQDDWLPLISAWKNDDGSISIIPNCKLRPGTKFILYPKGENAPSNAPDLRCTVKRDRVEIDEELVSVTAKKGQEL